MSQLEVFREISAVADPDPVRQEALYFSSWGRYLEPTEAFSPCAHYVTPLGPECRRAFVLSHAIPLPVSTPLSALLGTMLHSMDEGSEIYIQSPRSRNPHHRWLTEEHLQQTLPHAVTERGDAGGRDWIRIRWGRGVSQDVEALRSIYPPLVARLSAYLDLLRSLGFADEDPAADYSRSLEKYFIDPMWRALSSHGVIEQILRTRPLPRRGDVRWLEVGGGKGFLACQLALLDYEVTNLDPYAPAINSIMPWLAESCGVSDRVSGTVGAMERFQAEAESFDCITFMGSLLLCPRDQVGAVLTQTARMLKSSGLAIVYENIPTQERPDDAGKIKRFTAQELDRYLGAAFTDVTYFNHYGIEQPLSETMNVGTVFAAASPAKRDAAPPDNGLTSQQSAPPPPASRRGRLRTANGGMRVGAKQTLQRLHLLGAARALKRLAHTARLRVAGFRKPKFAVASTDTSRSRATDAGPAEPPAPAEAKVLRYETKCYRAEFDGRALSLHTTEGRALIDNLALSYSPCEIYNVASMLSSAEWIPLDRTGGLSAGDTVLVASNMYGGSSLKTYQALRTVAAVRKDGIVLDRPLPEHFVRYFNGLIVLRRGDVSEPSRISDAALTDAPSGGRLTYALHLEHARVACEIIMRPGSNRAEFHVRTKYHRSCRLYHMGFAVKTPLPLTELYLKNRTVRELRDGEPADDVWLWKEGCRAGDRAPAGGAWMVLHNPGLACVEIITQGNGFAWKTTPPAAGPSVLLNLEHYQAQRFRRHHTCVERTYSLFEDLSVAQFEPGDERSYTFTLHLGEDLPPPPRLMLAPKGHRAVHIWTEHADKTTLANHRAVCYGHESLRSTAQATGGFARHGHVITKSIFHDNPRNHLVEYIEHGQVVQTDVPTLAYRRDEQFRDLLDDLSQHDHEICVHAASPDNGPPEETHRAIEEITARYGSPTWIDHAMQYVHACLSFKGAIEGSPYDMRPHWRQHGIRYFWVWSSEDYMPKKMNMIDLLHESNGDYTPTPLYWRHPTVLGDLVIWAANECPLEYFSPEAVDALIQSRGVSVHHHYYPFICDELYPFGFIEQADDGSWQVTRHFDDILKMMAARRDDGELYLCTVGEIMEYWLSLESVRMELNPGNGFTLINESERGISGLSFVVLAEALHSPDVKFNSRRIDNGDLLVWFDLAAQSRAMFHHGSAGPRAAPAVVTKAPQPPSTNEVDWLLDVERGFVLFFRPRCGSTTLSRWFFENRGVKFGGFSISAFRNEWLQPRLAHLTSVLNRRYDRLHKFVVVRDPIERAVSSYLHVVNNPRDSQWDVVRPKVTAGLKKHDLTFRQFVEFLTREDLDSSHILWRRQSALSCWERGVDDVVPMQRMNEYLLQMNERFGLSATPTFNSVTVPAAERVHMDAASLFADTPFHELLRYKGKAHFQQFPDYPHFYDADLRRTVEKLYRDDIRIFEAAGS